MTQQPLFTPDATAPQGADLIDASLASIGLPYETRSEDGHRLCRDHAVPISGRGAPCPWCVAAGRGLGEPAATEEP